MSGAELVDRMVARARALTPAPGRARVLIGIAGAPGAGKTTLALQLIDHLCDSGDWRDSPVAHVPMDGFHLSDRELARLGRSERKGAPDTFDPSGYRALLLRIAAGETVWAPGFERDLEQPIAQELPVTEAARIVVSEGNYLLLPDPEWTAVRACFDEVWYVDIDDAVRRQRLIARHEHFGKSAAESREWVLRNDEANARLVVAHAATADWVLRP